MSRSHKIEGLLGLDASNWRRSGSKGQLPGRWNACTLNVLSLTRHSLPLDFRTPPVSNRPRRQCESQHPDHLYQHHFYTSFSFCLHYHKCPAEQSLHVKFCCSRSAHKASKKTLAVQQADIGNPEGEKTAWFMFLSSVKPGCNYVLDVTTARETSKSVPAEMNACLNILACSTPV